LVYRANFGQNKWIGTELDLASVKLNQTKFEFSPKSLFRGFKSEWKIENERCLEIYKSKYCIYIRMIYSSSANFIIPLYV
jgi:hypothetical protein